MNSTKINELQVLQQNLQNNLLQKQQLQTQLIELDSAIKELEKTNQAYKIVGKIMLASSKEKLSTELKEKKEITELRIKNYSEQEQKMQKNLDNLQKEVIDELKQKKD